jgi:hypothetical protein
MRASVQTFVTTGNPRLRNGTPPAEDRVAGGTRVLAITLEESVAAGGHGIKE